MVPPRGDVDDNHISESAISGTATEEQQCSIFLRRPQEEGSAVTATTPTTPANTSNDFIEESNKISKGDETSDGRAVEWMREHDAEILEKGIDETCSSGETPIMTPIKCTSPTSGSEPLMSLPPQSLQGKNLDLSQSFAVVHRQQQQQQQQQQHRGASGSESVDAYIGNPRVSSPTTGSTYDSASLAELRNKPIARTGDDNNRGALLQSLPLHTLKDQNSNNNEDIDTSKHSRGSLTNLSANDIPPLTPIRKVFFRRCLSGDERIYEVTGEPNENNNEFLESSSNSISFPGNAPLTVVLDNDSSASKSQGDKQQELQQRPEETPELIPEKEKISGEVSSLSTPSSTANSTKSGLMQRSKSRERLFSEAMQFAEAVGEAPPTESDLQQIIEDDGSDEDFESDDEAATEILIDKQNNIPVVSSSPQKMQRLTSLTGDTICTEDSEMGLAIDSGGDLDENDADVVVVVEPPTDVRSKLRWLFKPSKSKSHAYLHSLPENVAKQDYQYRGICANPPEITKRGLSRGNYAQLHRKAWLEVSDKYHRYGKNLRTYYRHWESLGHPTNMFFDWLDSKGEAAGLALPNLEECPRAQLDSDTVLYINNEESQQQYELTLVPDDKGRALFVDIDGDPIMTGVDGWIVVLRDHKLYGSEKITSITGHCKQRFHHSSFFSGKAVAAAGIIITDEDGFLTRFYPHSGHYRPGEAHVQRMLFHLHHCGIDLRTFEVDTQQILHVNRKDSAAQGKDGVAEEKKKKIQSLHLKQALYVACLLAHKARFIGEGISERIHKIRKADVASVTEALGTIDNGGYWKTLRLELSEQKMSTTS